MFVSIDLLGPNEMVISFVQYLSKNLLGRFILFSGICHTQYYEKNSQIFFSTGKVAFYQNLVFSTVSQVLNKAPIGSRVNVKIPCGAL